MKVENRYKAKSYTFTTQGRKGKEFFTLDKKRQIFAEFIEIKLSEGVDISQFVLRSCRYWDYQKILKEVQEKSKKFNYEEEA